MADRLLIAVGAKKPYLSPLFGKASRLVRPLDRFRRRCQTPLALPDGPLPRHGKIEWPQAAFQEEP